MILLIHGKNRDPRFYKTIMFDGVKWQSTGGAGGSSELFTNGRESEEKDEKKGLFHRLYEL